MSTIFSPGKLLLTSEYVVLDGALALAVPTKWGQEFFVEEISDEKNLVYWKALHQNQPWLNAVIDYEREIVVQTNIEDSAKFILKVLQTAKKLSKTKLQNNNAYSITTNLQFPADYGLGSSSTLMTNVAEWAGIDAFVLNDQCLGGSGYDIAIAQEKSTLLFQILNGERTFKTIDFNPVFKDELLFIHLNQKQNSREGIQLYRTKEKNPELIKEFSEITQQILDTTNLEEFSDLMTLHENKLSNLLGIKTVKEKYFENCPVFVKSLGAWGGDFIMTSKFPGFETYFQGKGFNTIFTWNDLIA